MNPLLPDRLGRPLVVGGRTLPNRLVLAPMTCLGHVAFRQLLDEMGGCGLFFSEMCSAARIPQENRHTSSHFRWRDAEADRLVVQILGSDPARMAAAAHRIDAEGLFGVDVNLGCAVSEICKYNQGAALLKDPRGAAALVAQIRREVTCPLWVKFRTGWQDDPRIPVDLARRLEDAGADALTFHPRVAPDVRNRPAKWDYIGRVKQAVRIPVFGNGDVFDADDCLRMLQTTGCDGVALGRLAIARPWVFAQWTGAEPPLHHTPIDVALRLITLLERHFDALRALRRFKRYGAYLAANFAFGNTLYNAIRNAVDMEAARQALIAFFESDPRLLRRPNMNLLR
jgi:nifR3 family TIM-barrel protein